MAYPSLIHVTFKGTTNLFQYILLGFHPRNHESRFSNQQLLITL